MKLLDLCLECMPAQCLSIDIAVFRIGVTSHHLLLFSIKK